MRRRLLVLTLCMVAALAQHFEPKALTYAQAAISSLMGSAVPTVSAEPAH